MSRFVVISEHTAEDCRATVKHFSEYYPGFLTHFEWGCYDNDHRAYATIEAESHDHALMAVPPAFRPKAKAIKVVTFDPRVKGDKLHTKDE